MFFRMTPGQGGHFIRQPMLLKPNTPPPQTILQSTSSGAGGLRLHSDANHLGGGRPTTTLGSSSSMYPQSAPLGHVHGVTFGQEDFMSPSYSRTHPKFSRLHLMEHEESFLPTRVCEIPPLLEHTETVDFPLHQELEAPSTSPPS